MKADLKRPTVALALALALALGACGDGGSPGGAEDAIAPPAPVEVATRDGVLRASMPPSLIVHAHAHSVFATSHDGTRRIYLTHGPKEELIRLSGATKDGLVARGWVVGEEKHLERATYLGATRKAPSGAVVARTIWLVDRDVRMVTCEAIEPGPLQGPAAALAMTLCREVEVAPPKGPVPPPP